MPYPNRVPVWIVALSLTVTSIFGLFCLTAVYFSRDGQITLHFQVYPGQMQLKADISKTSNPALVNQQANNTQKPKPIEDQAE